MTTTTTTIPTRRWIQSRNGYARRQATNTIMLSLTGVLTALALVPLFWIVGYVIYRGAPSLNLAFFTQLPRPLGMAGGGVLHAIEGTIILTALSGLIAIPPGVLAAFYVADHPNTPIGVVVRFGTDVLAGVPSIVVGLFGYALVVKTQGHYSALAGGVALAILMLPTIIRTTEEMLKLVPHTLREGSLALGAPEWKTSISVTLQAAGNGILTGFLLGLARASGETAPLLFTALGNERFELVHMMQGSLRAPTLPAALAHLPGPVLSLATAVWNLPAALWNVVEQPVDSLPLTMWKYAQQPYAERIDQSWAVALVLMVFVLLINIIVRIWSQARTSRMQGG